MSIIPHLSAQMPPISSYQSFLDTLKASPFQGDISVDLARRLVGATDNSVYQLLPQAIMSCP